MPGRFLFRFGMPGCCCADELLSGAIGFLVQLSLLAIALVLHDFFFGL
jgi:hypothetical protein